MDVLLCVPVTCRRTLVSLVSGYYEKAAMRLVCVWTQNFFSLENKGQAEAWLGHGTRCLQFGRLTAH